MNPILRIIKEMFAYGLEKFGRYYSTYRGFVISNEDPDKMQRLQLKIPEVGGDTVYEYWAYPHGVFSGPGYGSQVIPQIGEVVWVSFESGHPQVPIWSHGYPGITDVPNDKELQDKECYWFKTPKGNLVKINDTKKCITIETTSGYRIKLDDQKELLSLNAPKDKASIILNGSGLISIKNKDTDIKTLFTNILTTYMSTMTIDGKPLNPASIHSAVDNLVTLNKLFI